jgi:hypothetical protein
VRHLLGVPALQVCFRRLTCVCCSYQHFKQRAGGKENVRLLHYARRLEEELYRRAQSVVRLTPLLCRSALLGPNRVAFLAQAHYQDPSTLSARLSEAVKMLNLRRAAQNGVMQPPRQAGARVCLNPSRSGTDLQQAVARM